MRGCFKKEHEAAEAGIAVTEVRIARWRRIERAVDRWILLLLAAAVLISGALALDSFREGHRPKIGADPHDFGALLQINPDTVAWIRIDGTGIDAPIVQGKDNFEYLNKAFTGEFSAGGSLFLDSGNAGDFSDAYSIVYGHNIAGGAGLGGLKKFLEEDYREEHTKGTLLTPSGDYPLRLAGAGVFNAYDGRVFSPGRRPAVFSNGRILALSTCTDDMNDDRALVFWKIGEKKR